MMKIFLIFEILFVSFFSYAKAQDVPYTFVVSATDSDCFFVMDRGEKGACYIARASDKIELLWKTQGWYSFSEELILTPDGNRLMRVASIISDGTPMEKLPFLYFYERGQLVRSYTLGELNIDLTKIVGYYLTPEKKLILGGEHGAKLVTQNELLPILDLEENAKKISELKKSATRWANCYLLVETIDGQRFVFEPHSGELLLTENPNKAQE